MTNLPSRLADFTKLSAYEQKTWTSAVERLNTRRDGLMRKFAAPVTKPVGRLTVQVWKTLPLHENLEESVFKAMRGLKAVTFDPALRSVNAGKPLSRRGFSDRRGLLALDLEEIDRSFPRLRTAYTGAALIEGGGSALAVTGAEVATTVSAGATAGVAAGAIAADVVASMAIMGRVIGRVAAEYGYDVRLPDEEAFALGIISLGTAGTAAEKVAALASLRRLANQMMRQATWAELNQSVLVQIIRRTFDALGERLTKQKLGQAVPIAGVLINAGLSAQMADSTYRTARDVYRLRFLSEKYDIDPGSWTLHDESDPDDVLGAALDDADNAGGGPL
ncbi:EcsC family protein [Nocardioides plantarum]|uniref:EcsC family protein n=1 Tax=Nocardioides plantarum TaxID=29299 RepID=A0ABV5KEH9_9ACTN|nr:EcsC family protein [Nocardioides plantarum]